MSRAVAPVFATILLVAIVVVTAGVVSVVAVGFTSTLPDTTTGAEAVENPIELEVVGQTLHFTNTGTETIDVDELTLEISVSDQPVAFQPTIPYFSTTGFEPGPSGPFNIASNTTWVPGQDATITIADTNEPVPQVGDTVTVELWYKGEYYGKTSSTVE